MCEDFMSLAYNTGKYVYVKIYIIYMCLCVYVCICIRTKFIMADIMRMSKMLLTSVWVKIQQEAEAAWKLTTIKKNLTGESNFWIDFRTMRS